MVDSVQSRKLDHRGVRGIPRGCVGPRADAKW